MNPEETKNLLEETRRGLERGWRYALLDGKKPLHKRWQKKPATEDAIEKHILDGGNVGVLTGKLSGGLVVLDFDGDQGRAFFEEHADLQNTVVVQTGRNGRHAYFRHDKPVLGCSRGTLPDYIDFRGTGGQVVAVGSIHPDTGRAYVWLPGHSPDDIDPAPLPMWLVEMLPVKKDPVEHTPPAQKPVAFTGVGPTPTSRANSALVRECNAVAGAPKGIRNERLDVAAFTMGGYVGAGEIDEDTVRTALLSVADSWESTEHKKSRRTVESGLASGKARPFQPQILQHKRGAWGFYYQFMDQWHGFLSSTVSCCWQVLFRNADKNTFMLELSVAKIAASMGMASRTAERALDTLRARNLLEVMRAGGPETGANIYRLIMPAELPEITDE